MRFFRFPFWLLILLAFIAGGFIGECARGEQCDRVIEISGRCGCTSWRWEAAGVVSISTACGCQVEAEWPPEADGWRAFDFCDPALLIVADVTSEDPLEFDLHRFGGCIASDPAAWCDHRITPGEVDLVACLPPNVPMRVCIVFTDPIFANGFESGDTSAWSGVVP